MGVFTSGKKVQFIAGGWQPAPLRHSGGHAPVGCTTGRCPSDWFIRAGLHPPENLHKAKIRSTPIFYCYLVIRFVLPTFHPYLWKQKLIFLLVLLLSGSYVAAQDAGIVQLYFEHKAGNEILELDRTYTNDFNESYTVSRFRYYISHITLMDTAGSRQFVPDDTYFLVKEGDDMSKTITLHLPPGNYNQLRFMVGVDSLKNVSGAQSGALDPLHGMFWTWKTGYIMAKLEGRSPASPLQHRMFEYHIGGFSGEHSVLQTVTLSLPHTLTVTAGATAGIRISADVNKWFSARHRLPIADHPACTTISTLAKQFSENYLAMFAIQKPEAE